MPELVPSGFFIIRSPLLPIESFLEWGQGDDNTLVTRLREIMKQPEVREALFVSSPGFEARFDALASNTDDRKQKKYERALVRYFARMSGRATPLGLSAGCTFGAVGEHTRLELSGRQDYRRLTGIDVDYLSLLADELVRDKSLSSQLSLSLNSSLFCVAGSYHFIQGQAIGSGYSYSPLAVESSPLLAAVLESAGEGKNLSELAKRLTELVPAITKDKAQALIGELVDQQILVPACSPAVTGRGALDELIDELEGIPQADDVVRNLSETRAALRDVDTRFDNSPGHYRRIADGLGPMPVKPDISRLFQAQMLKPAAGATLGKDVVNEIARGIEWLRAWFGPGYPDPLGAFRTAFRERYGDREVRLVEALDEDVGIGEQVFGDARGSSPLLEDLPLPETAVVGVEPDVRHDVMLRRLGQALESGDREIRMTWADLELLRSLDAAPPLPDALSVMGSLAADSIEALAGGDFRFLLQGSMGPPSTILLGRHCHADDDLCDAVREHLRQQDAKTPDAIVAEVVYSPKGRLANIQARPVLSEYEIPYLGRSALPQDRQIPIDDLLVSVRDDKTVLRSARLKRRVIPRMSSAHNFRRDENTTYRFLCSLQIEGVCWWLRWDWGALRQARFLPRVVLDRLVLSPATWNLDRKEIQDLAQTTGEERISTFDAWRTTRGVPRYVSFVDADEKMLCDLGNAISVETLVELVKDRETATLEELLPAPEELAVAGPEGRFAHDLVVPFDRKSDSVIPESVSDLSAQVSSPRGKMPGSDWLFVKVYSGPVTADRLLQEFVAPFVEDLDRGAVSRWFFIRYADPDPHLRLRFEGDPAYLQRELMPVLHEKLEELQRVGKLWRVAVDTYEREFERYGGYEGMPLAEQFFEADSIAALSVVESCPGDAGSDARWRLTLKGVDFLFDDFGMSLDARARVLERLRTSFNREFHADRSPLKHRLGESYRLEREGIDALLDEIGEPSPLLESGLAALRERSESLQGVIDQIRASHEHGSLGCPIEDLLPSYIHMQCNRMLRWPHRPQEMVLYEYLGRHYDSRLARARQSR